MGTEFVQESVFLTQVLSVTHRRAKPEQAGLQVRVIVVVKRPLRVDKQDGHLSAASSAIFHLWDERLGPHRHPLCVAFGARFPRKPVSSVGLSSQDSPLEGLSAVRVRVNSNAA